MQKYKISNKNGQLNIYYKIKSAQSINQLELSVFSNQLIRSFMNPSVAGKKITYVSPVAIPLPVYLSRGIDKATFFIIFAQINEAIKRLDKYHLRPSNLVMDFPYVFITSATRELHFIYQPLNGIPVDNNNNVYALMYSVIQNARFNAGEDTSFLSYVTNFLKSMPVYSTQKTEQYILNMYPKAYQLVVREKSSLSSHLSDKKYHIEKSQTGEHIVLDKNFAAPYNRGTSSLESEDTDDTSLLNEVEVDDNSSNSGDDTTLLDQAQQELNEVLYEIEPEADTALLNQEQKWENDSSLEDEQDEGTTFLDEQVPEPDDIEEQTSFLREEFQLPEEQQVQQPYGGASAFVQQGVSAQPVQTGAASFFEEDATSLLTDEDQADEGAEQQSEIAPALENAQQNIPQQLPREQEVQQRFVQVAPPPQPAQQIPSQESVSVSSNTTVVNAENAPFATRAQSAAVTVAAPTPEVFEEDEEEEEATSLLTEESEGTKLVETHSKDYPFLLRLNTYDRVEITKNLFTIGKEKSKVDCFISNNNAVSRVHANIIVKNNRFYIMDRKTTNGTFVNGARIQPGVEFEITHGDSIMLANEAFEFYAK